MINDLFMSPFNLNYLTLALKSLIAPESPGLNVPFHGSTDNPYNLGTLRLTRGSQRTGQSGPKFLKVVVGFLW